MTTAELEALMGPVAEGRVRVVMKPRGPQPPRVHADYRALVDSPLEWPVQPVDTRVAIVAALAGLLAAVLLVALAVAL